MLMLIECVLFIKLLMHNMLNKPIYKLMNMISKKHFDNITNDLLRI